MEHALRPLMRWICSLGLLALCSGCATLDPRAPSPAPLAEDVNLERLNGDWYVIAHISTERDSTAHNAVENYQLRPDGNVDVVYTNRLGGFDGEPKKMTPKGFPVEGSGNALWGMRFDIPGLGLPWPFQFEYRISHLEPDYSALIVGRSKLDFVWLMAREPEIPESDYERYKALMASWGYDVSQLVRVPQRWPDKE